MPFWCGAWGTSAGWWWIFPLVCFGVMAVFAFLCMRGLGCMGWRMGRRPNELTALDREIQELKEEVQKLRRAT
jgi:hypothetical protein